MSNVVGMLVRMKEHLSWMALENQGSLQGLLGCQDHITVTIEKSQKTRQRKRSDEANPSSCLPIYLRMQERPDVVVLAEVWKNRGRTGIDQMFKGNGAIQKKPAKLVVV